MVRKKDDVLSRIFGVDSSEDSLEECYCSLVTDQLGPVKGALYCTAKHLCFYDSKTQEKLFLTWTEIETVEKKNTAMVIPNAIEVILKRDGKQHTFLGFEARDKTYSILYDILHGKVRAPVALPLGMELHDLSDPEYLVESVEWTELKPERKQFGIPGVSGHACTVIGNEIYIFGGWNGVRYFNDIWIYSVENNAWRTADVATKVPAARLNHTLAAVDHEIFLIGGSDGSKVLKDTFVYDTVTSCWDKPKILSKHYTPRQEHTCTTVGKRLYIYGGIGAENDHLNDLFIFDTEKKYWSQARFTGKYKDGPYRHRHTATKIQDTIYVVGGLEQDEYSDDIWSLDLVTLSWSKYTPFPREGGRPNRRHSHSAVAVGKNIIVFGGSDSNGPLDDIWVLDTAVMVWKSVDVSGTVPLARSGHGCVPVGKTVYLFGGCKGQASGQSKVQGFKTGAGYLSDILALHPAVSKRSNADMSLIERQNDLLENLSHEHFDVQDTLGTGSFGRVRLVKHKASGKYYAMKILKKIQIVKLKQVDHLHNEKNVLMTIRHPFIVNLVGAFQDERHLYMVMEYVCGGEFFTHLRRANRFSNAAARFYAAEIILALAHLHDYKIAYRDLKPENLLLDKEGHVKITDFGFAKKVEHRTWTLCGTPEYLAPEILQNKGHSRAVDWWAMGILIFEMLAGYPPFYDEDPLMMYQKILAGRIEFPGFFDRNAKDLIKRLLQADLTKRLGNMRRGAVEIMEHKWFAGLDWNMVLRREVKPPFVPIVKDDSDTSNFEKYPESVDRSPPLREKDQQLFDTW